MTLKSYISAHIHVEGPILYDFQILIFTPGLQWINLEQLIIQNAQQISRKRHV